MIRNVIFDLGNVLLRFRPEKLIMDTFNDENTCRALMEAVFRAPEWLLLDKGTISPEEATKAFVGYRPDFETEIKEIMSIWTKALTPIEPHVEILENMKNKGMDCYILSNFHKDAYEEQRERHAFFDHFKGGVVSAYVHQLKPDHDIYESLLNKYGLEPQSCLFLDDVEENIKAAKELGIHGIQVTADIDLKTEIDNFLEAN